MTAVEQEKLFERVRKRFRRQSVRWASGYVHGVVDESLHKRPTSLTIKLARMEDYSKGYLCGFSDARGSDICKESGISEIFYRAENFQWWKN